MEKGENIFLAMHFGRTRYMKCPECGKRSWQKSSDKRGLRHTKAPKLP